MFDLPLATHRYFIEPLTGLPHVRRIVARRFLKFINMIRSSDKKAAVELLDLVESDVRTTTGHNLRSIMLEAGKHHIDIMYHEVTEDEACRVDFLKEIVEIKHGELEASGLTTEELLEIYKFLCTQ